MEKSEINTDNGSTTTTEDMISETGKKKHRTKRKKDKNGISDSDTEAQYEIIKLKAFIDEIMKDRERCYARINELEKTLKAMKENCQQQKENNQKDESKLITVKSTKEINENKNNQKQETKYNNDENKQIKGNNQQLNKTTPNNNNVSTHNNEMDTDDWIAEVSREETATTPGTQLNPNLENINTQLNKNINKANTGKASPPIIKISKTNIRELALNLKKTLKNDHFTINTLQKKMIELKVTKIEDFYTAKEFLDKEKIPYFTYTPKDLKPRTLILKGISENWEKEDIEGFIFDKKLNIDIKSIIKLNGDRWLVQVDNSTDLAVFKKLQYFLYQNITIEKYKKEGLIQCRNCQGHGHISTNCRMPYRCVKCPGNHGPGECPIPPKELNNKEQINVDPVTGEISKTYGIPVYCCNCKQTGHVASSKVCPVKIRLLEKLKERKMFKSQPTINQQASVKITSPKVSKDLLYSSIAKTGTSVPKNTPPQNTKSDEFMQIFDSDCKRLLGKDFFTCLQKIGSHVEHYKKLNTDEERTRSLYQLFTSLKLDD